MSAPPTATTNRATTIGRSTSPVVGLGSSGAGTGDGSAVVGAVGGEEVSGAAVGRAVAAGVAVAVGSAALTSKDHVPRSTWPSSLSAVQRIS
jgi:hypothetical protein